MKFLPQKQRISNTKTNLMKLFHDAANCWNHIVGERRTNEYRELVEWNWLGRTEVLPVSEYHKISRGIGRDWNRLSGVRRRRLTASAIARPYSLLSKSREHSYKKKKTALVKNKLPVRRQATYRSPNAIVAQLKNLLVFVVNTAIELQK